MTTTARLGEDDKAKAALKAYVLEHYGESDVAKVALMTMGDPLPGPKALSEIGWVYFTSTDEVLDFPIKIGFSLIDPTLRILGLQTGNPYRLSLLASFRATLSAERAIHRDFARWRLEGEWFRRNDRLLDLIHNVQGPEFQRASQSSGSEG